MRIAQSFAILVLLTCPSIASGQDPKPQATGVMISFEIIRHADTKAVLLPLPKEDASMQDWKNYSYVTLQAMFPEEVDEIAKTVIIPSPNTGLVSGKGIGQIVNNITFNVSLVRAVVESPEDFGALIGHEFAHFIVLRDQTLAAKDNDEESDRLSTDRIEDGVCHWAAVVERMLQTEEYKSRQDSVTLAINQARIDKLNVACHAK